MYSSARVTSESEGDTMAAENELKEGSTVQRSAYRQPVTAKGLKGIEDGTLTWLDDEMYNNLNTGVLEQYLEEKNLEESFEVSHWSSPKVLLGIAIGAVFSGVTAYTVSYTHLTLPTKA